MYDIQLRALSNDIRLGALSLNFENWHKTRQKTIFGPIFLLRECPMKFMDPWQNFS